MAEEEEKGSWTTDLDLDETGRDDASEPRLDMVVTWKGAEHNSE